MRTGSCAVDDGEDVRREVERAVGAGRMEGERTCGGRTGEDC